MSQDLGFSSYHAFTGKLEKNLKDIIKLSFSNFFEVLEYKITSKKFKTIQIDISYKNYSTLLKDRKKAINFLILRNPTKVSGKITIDDKTYRVKIRLKGDNIGHWSSQYRMSLRVEVLDGLTIFGNSKFSITKPAERAHPYDMVFQKVMIDAGNLATNHQFANIIVNGIKWGIMDIEEHMTPSFLEKQKRKNSLIIRFSNEDKLAYEKNPKNTYRHYKISDPSLYIHLYNKNKTLKENINRKIFSYISEQHINYKKELYDVNSFTKAFVISNIWNFHPLNASNVRFYFNPFTLKLEPIITDQAFFWWDKKLFRKTNYKNDHEMQHFYKTINSDEFRTNFDQNIKIVKKSLSNSQKYFNMNKDLFPLDLEINVEEMVKEQEKILSKPQSYYLNLENKKKNDNNLIELPTKKQSSLFSEHLVIRHYIDGNIHVHNLIPDDVIIKEILHNGKMIDSKEYNIPSYLSKKKSIIIQTNITGYQDNKFTIISEYKNKISKSNNYITLINDDIKNPLFQKMSEYFFLEKLDKENYKIMQGSWVVDSPLVIEGNLEINENTTIEFTKNAYMIIKGKIKFLGTKSKPIILRGQSKSWKGIYIIEAKEKSIIKNVILSDISELDEGILDLTGGITFYRSNLLIDNLEISNTFSEDAINIIESNYEIKNLKIYNTISDGIDFDFSNGNINNSIFQNIGGDAIDFAGTNGSLNKIEINNVKDKGISVGENSDLKASNININNTKIGIATKDGSNLLIKNCKIDNSSYVAVATYIKKDFYLSPKMLINNCEINPINSHLKQKGTMLFIDDKEIKETSFKTKNLYN